MASEMVYMLLKLAFHDPHSIELIYSLVCKKKPQTFYKF